MGEAVRFGQKPCRFHWEIGSGYCDNCGARAGEHEGYAMLREGAGPFGGDDAWEGVPWAEFDARQKRAAEVRAARERLAALTDDQAVALAAAKRTLSVEGTDA